MPWLLKHPSCDSHQITTARICGIKCGWILHHPIQLPIPIRHTAHGTAACVRLRTGGVLPLCQGSGLRVHIFALDLSKQFTDCRCTSMSGVSEDLMRTQRCKRCRRAAYCDTACQSAHWPAHKASCAVRSGFLAAKAASAADVASEATKEITDGVD